MVYDNDVGKRVRIYGCSRNGFINRKTYFDGVLIGFGKYGIAKVETKMGNSGYFGFFKTKLVTYIEPVRAEILQ